MTIFHLAFTSHNLNQTKAFYVDSLGFGLGRETKHALILDFHGNQLVAHLVDKPLPMPKTIYPNHFGLIFESLADFNAFKKSIIDAEITFYSKPKIRHPNTAIEHHSMFINDPSNNLLEFKYYSNPEAIFNAKGVSKIGE